MSQIAFSYPTPPASRIFLWGLVSCLIGISLAPYLPVVPQLHWVLLGSVFLAVVSRRYFQVFAIVCCGLLLGWWRYGLVSTANPFAGTFDEPVTISGTITAEVDRRVDQQQLTVTVTEINDQSQAGKLLIRAPLYPLLSYGEQLQTRCTIRQPGQIDDFEYDRYLALSGISAYCSAQSVRVTGQHQGQFVLAKIYDFKQLVLTKINRLLSEPEASFAAGLLIGARRGIPEEVQTAFNRTGTTHIIAISGYNITLIATIFQAMLLPLVGRKRAFWVIVIALGVFVILTGAQASVVRAAVMGVIVLLAKRLGRRSRMTTALALAAVVMVLSNPLVLRDDKGFQLSFLATIGLVYLSPRLERYTRFVTGRFGLRDSLTATLASTLATLPLIVVTFGRLSLVALIANMLILPMIPLAMALSFGAVVTATFFVPLGTLVSWLAWAALHYVIVVATWLASFPWSSVDIPSLPWWVTLVGFTILGAIIVPRLELVRPSLKGFRYER